jgi:hypothetical protein
MNDTITSSVYKGVRIVELSPDHFESTQPPLRASSMAEMRSAINEWMAVPLPSTRNMLGTPKPIAKQPAGQWVRNGNTVIDASVW